MLATPVQDDVAGFWCISRARLPILKLLRAHDIYEGMLHTHACTYIYVCISENKKDTGLYSRRGK